MKRLILAIGLLSPHIAAAQSGFYAGASIGGTYFLDQSYETDVDIGGGIILQNAGDVDVEYDLGLNVAAQVGYQLDTNIRIEGEVAYSAASGERTFSFDNIASTTDQDITILKGTAGVFLDLWPVAVVVPYVGAGIGYANVVVDNDDFGDDEQNVFTAFAEGGVPYNATPELAIVPSVRFNWYNTKERLADEIALPIIGKDLYNVDFRVGARYAF